MGRDKQASAVKRLSQVRGPLRRSLLAWYRRSARDFPWRRTRDPYRIWLAEVLLQQTRAETAVPYYERLVRAFPTVERLAKANEDRVLKLWEGLGYYTRARNLLKAARIIVHENDGRFPRTAQAWQRLPGVGRYTAGAVASIAFDQRVPVLDGNVKRVLTRVLNIGECIDDARVVSLLWSVSETLVPARSPGQFNQALMELGARVCTPKGPRCGQCPLGRYCRARVDGRQESLPVRRARRPVPHYQIVAAAIQRNGRYLLGKRPSGSLLGGLWELPGGKVRAGETHQQALARELAEELGIEAAVGSHIASINHAYSHFRITLNVYRCTNIVGRPKTRHYGEIRWILPTRLARYALPAATRKVLDLL